MGGDVLVKIQISSDNIFICTFFEKKKNYVIIFPVFYEPTQISVGESLIKSSHFLIKAFWPNHPTYERLVALSLLEIKATITKLQECLVRLKFQWNSKPDDPQTVNAILFFQHKGRD